MIIPERIIGELKENALKNSNAFAYSYVSNEEEIVSCINRFNGIKSEFYCRELKGLRETSKFLSIFSDFTSVFTLPGSRNNFQMQYFTDNHIFNIERTVTIPQTLINTSLRNGYNIVPSYLYKNNQDTRDIFLNLGPFFEKGQFLLRPMRTLIARSGDTTFDMFYAYSDTAINQWQIKEINEKDSYAIDNGLKPFESRRLIELVVPYFEDVSLTTLSKILNDEQDTVAQFRAALKSLVKDIEHSQSNANQVRIDKIEPQLQNLNKKFKAISSIHRKSVAGTVSAFTLTLIGIATQTDLNFQTIFGALGAAGLGLLATELNFDKGQGEMRDNPYFLLWKISKSK